MPFMQTVTQEYDLKSTLQDLDEKLMNLVHNH